MKAHKEKPHKENLHNFVPAQPKLKHVQSHFESLWFKAAFCCRMLLRSSLCRPARDKNVTVARDDFTGNPVAAVCHRLQKMVLHYGVEPIVFQQTTYRCDRMANGSISCYNSFIIPRQYTSSCYREQTTGANSPKPLQAYLAEFEYTF